MKSVLALLALCSAAVAMSTTRHPHVATTTHQHAHLQHNPMYNLIQHEVNMLLHQHPDLNVDNCTTKCDAMFDLIVKVDEQNTDQLCHYECNRRINGHHHYTGTHHHTTTGPTAAAFN